jgi:thymidylate synthase ThyX
MSGSEADDMKILEKHVSNTASNIYTIFNLPPEVVAVLFAYVSRSPASFRDNLLKLIKSKDLNMDELIQSYATKGLDYGEAREKAKKFHERWVVGYGHSSVAEHAIAHIALEDVSILASKVIEDNRLAAYTEKSTRYQIFDRGRYFKPPKLMKSDSGRIYQETCDALFDFYTESFPKMIEFMKEKHPKPEDMSDGLYESITKARACDVLRYALPASTFTSIGMTANARTIEHMITKLLSQPLEEMTEIGEKVKEEARKLIPTLVKYADKNAYIAETDESMAGNDGEVGEGKTITLVRYDPDAEEKIVSAILYRYSATPYEKIMEKVKSMDDNERAKIIDDFLSKRGKHDQPLRELEHAYYTFDTLVDYGAFRDIQRHRICTQTNQKVTTRNGYDTPPELKEVGLEERFVGLMEKAKTAYEAIRKELPEEAQYVVPLAFRKRTLFTLNLRELHHLISLRSGREGHISYRKVAWLMHDEIAKVHPNLAKYIRVDRDDGPSR